MQSTNLTPYMIKAIVAEMFAAWRLPCPDIALVDGAARFTSAGRFVWVHADGTVILGGVGELAGTVLDGVRQAAMLQFEAARA